jgi:exopolyphosphatase/guanosine-5'-triphosphate,3'-diphosphate pyrophosphatase
MKTACYAAIDVGTNSTLLTVMRRMADGNFEILSDQSAITQLGEGVSNTHNLNPEAINRTITAVKSFQQIAQEQGAIRIFVVGTSALRDAENRADFESALAVHGLSLRILSGEEEAKLSFLSVALDPTLNLPEPLAVFDIGGGSLELAVGSKQNLKMFKSIPAGAVRLTEQLVQGNPPSSKQLQAAIPEIDHLLSDLTISEPIGALVGVGGTVVNILSSFLRLPEFNPTRLHGKVLTAQNIHSMLELYCSMTTNERRKLTGLEPKRALYMPAGTLVIERLLAVLNKEELIVSTHGLRYGVLLEAFGKENLIN